LAHEFSFLSKSQSERQNRASELAARANTKYGTRSEWALVRYVGQVQLFRRYTKYVRIVTMKLVFACSPSHQVLRDTIFLPTLRDPWELIEIPVDVPGNGDFRSDGFYEAVAVRTRRYVELVRRFPGEIIVFSDVDIQWFRPAQADLMQAMEGLDMVFQRDHAVHCKVNLGFFAVQANARSENMLTRIADAAAHRVSDQNFVNDLVRQNAMPCRFGLLPATYFNDALKAGPIPPREQWVLYHSIFTLPRDGKSSIQLKLEKHAAVARAAPRTSKQDVHGDQVPILADRSRSEPTTDENQEPIA